jgi:C_GCAxxG_C_C family probable redox protein
MKVSEKYQGLTRQALLDKAHELGVNYERCSTGCSQSTVAALHDILGFDDSLVRVASSSCAGQAAQAVGTCGGLIGGTLVLDYYFGRPKEKMSDKEYSQEDVDILLNAMSIAKLLYDKYVKEYGTVICPHIQTQLFGRHFYLWDTEELAKFEEAGGHSDPAKCVNIVGNAVRWTLEILIDQGVVEL